MFITISILSISLPIAMHPTRRAISALCSICLTTLPGLCVIGRSLSLSNSERLMQGHGCQQALGPQMLIVLYANVPNILHWPHTPLTTYSFCKWKHGLILTESLRIGAQGKVLLLRALAVLPDDWSLVLSTHVRGFIIIWKSSSRGSDISSGHCRHPCAHAQKYSHAYKVT